MSFVFLVALGLLILSGEFHAVYAYIGPGVGITMLGALWAVLLAVVLAIGGVLLWPIRALILRWRSAKTKQSSKDPPS